jgi:predicted nucleic acid-binding protein
MDATTPAVVDTDVISFLVKDYSLAPSYLTILAGRPLAVSLISLAEIEYAMEVKNWGQQARSDAFSHPLYTTAPGHRDCSRVGTDQKRV